jgi:hypothetical protein
VRWVSSGLPGGVVRFEHRAPFRRHPTPKAALSRWDLVGAPAILAGMDELPEDEEGVWRAIVVALRLKGATPAEAIDRANLLLVAYRAQRDSVLHKSATGAPALRRAPVAVR